MLFVCTLLGEDEELEVEGGKPLCGAAASIVLLLQPYLCGQMKASREMPKQSGHRVTAVLGAGRG